MWEKKIKHYFPKNIFVKLLINPPIFFYDHDRKSTHTKKTHKQEL